MTRLLAAALCLALLGGCGSHAASTSQPTRSAPAATTKPAQLPELPDPCRDPRGFARAIRKLEKRPGVEVSQSAKRLLRLLTSKEGAANCSSSRSYLDQFETITKKQ